MSQKIEMDKLFGPSVLNNESFMKNLFGVSSIVNNPPNTEPRAQNRPTIKFMSGNDVNVPPFNSFVTPSRSQVQSLSKNNGISYEQFSKLKLTDDNMSERPEINYHLSLSNSTAMVTDVQNNESNQGTPFPFVSSFFQSKPVEKVVTKKSTNFYEQSIFFLFIL